MIMIIKMLIILLRIDRFGFFIKSIIRENIINTSANTDLIQTKIFEPVIFTSIIMILL